MKTSIWTYTGAIMQAFSAGGWVVIAAFVLDGSVDLPWWVAILGFVGAVLKVLFAARIIRAALQMTYAQGRASGHELGRTVGRTEGRFEAQRDALLASYEHVIACQMSRPDLLRPQNK